MDRGIAPDGVPIETREALRWATINGAAAAGLDNSVGSLTPGKVADIVMIRKVDINLAGFNDRDPTSTVVLQAHPGNVDTVLVAGNDVKRDGRLIADVAAAVAAVTESQQQVAHAVEKLGGFRSDPASIRPWDS